MRIPSLHDIFASLGFLAVLAVLIYAGKWAWDEYRHPKAEVDFGKYPVRGIDISAHNGEVDFEKVAGSGIKFVWIKASEGETLRDVRFQENFAGALSAGLSAGAYHFFRFDCDGVMQAMNLCQALGDVRPEMGIAIDIELENNAENIDDETIVSNIESMTDYLRLRGYPITLYSNKEGYARFVRDHFSDYPLWICSFSDGEPIEDAPWVFWQYSHTGKIPGVSGKCDENVFRYAASELSRFHTH